MSRNSFALSKVNEEYLNEDLADRCYYALKGHLQSYFLTALGHNEISHDSFCHDSLPFHPFFAEGATPEDTQKPLLAMMKAIC